MKQILTTQIMATQTQVTQITTTHQIEKQLNKKLATLTNIECGP